MSAPQKPWENNRTANQVPLENNHTARRVLSNSSAPRQGRNVLHSHNPQPCGYVPSMNTPISVSQRGGYLPPLPQRPPQLFNRASFGMASSFAGYPGYTTGYSGYNTGYSGYGSGYTPYGSIYGGYNHGAFPGGFENRFLQVAEESSRDAFQSIESIVRAFASVSMMLESTYYAMYSSFRAVLGVVDNFSRLRQIFVQFLSTITVLRIIRNFYRRLLHWLGVLDNYSPQADSVWESVSSTSTEGSVQVKSSPKWPLFTFLGLLFGGPYLISKFFSPDVSSTSGNRWDLANGRYIRTAYPHSAGTDAELSFQANETLNLAPQEMQTFEASGWMLASNHSGRIGYVPITRLATTAPNNTQIQTSAQMQTQQKPTTPITAAACGSASASAPNSIQIQTPAQMQTQQKPTTPITAAACGSASATAPNSIQRQTPTQTYSQHIQTNPVPVTASGQEVRPTNHGQGTTSQSEEVTEKA